MKNYNIINRHINKCFTGFCNIYNCIFNSNEKRNTKLRKLLCLYQHLGATWTEICVFDLEKMFCQFVSCNLLFFIDQSWDCMTTFLGNKTIQNVYYKEILILFRLPVPLFKFTLRGCMIYLEIQEEVNCP